MTKPQARMGFGLTLALGRNANFPAQGFRILVAELVARAYEPITSSKATEMEICWINVE